jgi:sulfate adenylyltransferase subunit 1
MVTAASTADLAVILVDARKGVITQTRRHSYLAHLVGIPHLVVAVNKMDLVNYDQSTFEQIRNEYLSFAEQLGITDVRFLPLSALKGDMVVERGSNLNWYQGQTLMEILETATTAHDIHVEAFRLPVQYVCRPQDSTNPELHDYRGFMGRVESGSIKVGERVTVLPSGLTSTIKAIELGGERLVEAVTDQSVTLLLEDEIDISRGDMLVRASELPTQTKQIETTVCWLSETPLDKSRTYLIRHTTRETKAKIASINYRVDVNSLERQSTERLAMNDIAVVNFKLAQPLFTDAYRDNRSTGAFIVIDESTNNTVGAGMIGLLDSANSTEREAA